MDINSKDYINSFDNIIPSEDFLAKTKNAMLKEAEKQNKRKRIMLRLTPIAAAACVVLVFAYGMINQPKSADNSMPESIMLDEEQSYDSNTEKEDEIYYDEADDYEPLIEDESHDEPLENPAAGEAYDDDEAKSESNNKNYYDNITDEEIVEDDNEGSDDDTTAYEVPLNFAVPVGGKALEFPDFSPDDTEKLAEFLAIVSKDMINAEIIYSNGETADIFGEEAKKISLEITENINTSKITAKTDFEPTVSYTFFDDKTGSVLYSIRTDGIFTAISIKNGEEVYFQN